MSADGSGFLADVTPATPLSARAGTSRRDTALLWAIFALALILRAADALGSSLQLDDFHTLFHARAPSLGEFFQGLRRDNHPPLSFLVVRGLRGLLGESEFVLRTPAVLYGAATVFFVWRMARRLPGQGARAAATLLVACSSLNMQLSADLRMYSLLTLAVTAFLDAALDLLEQRRGFARAALWSVVGLHTHYHFLHALVVLVGACVLVAGFHARSRPGLGRLLQALGLAAVLCAPWYAWGFTAQLQHDLAPGGATTSLLRFLEGLVHLVFLNVRLGGALPRMAFLAGGALVLGLALVAALRSLSHARLEPSARVNLVLVAGAFLLPAWSALVAWISPRAGFEWRYIAGAVSPLALLAAHGAWCAGPWARVRRLALGCAIVAAFALCVLNAIDPGREDFKGAIRAIVARARASDALIAAEWSPRIFPRSNAWNYYGPRLAPPGGQLPHLIDHREDFSLAPEVDLSPYPRVFFLGRSIPSDVPLLERLRSEFAHESAALYGQSIWVLTFER